MGGIILFIIARAEWLFAEAGLAAACNEGRSTEPRRFMLKHIRWNTFSRDLFVIQIGFMLYALAISLVIRASLGTGTWVVLEVALAKILGIKIGTMTVYMGLSVLVIVLALREQCGMGNVGKHLKHWSVVEFVFGVHPNGER